MSKKTLKQICKEFYRDSKTLWTDEAMGEFLADRVRCALNPKWWWDIYILDGLLKYKLWTFHDIDVQDSRNAMVFLRKVAENIDSWFIEF